MNFDRKNLDDNNLLKLYKHLLKPRMIEEKMLILLSYPVHISFALFHGL